MSDDKTTVVVQFGNRQDAEGFVQAMEIEKKRFNIQDIKLADPSVGKPEAAKLELSPESQATKDALIAKFEGKGTGSIVDGSDPHGIPGLTPRRRNI